MVVPMFSRGFYGTIGGASTDYIDPADEYRALEQFQVLDGIDAIKQAIRQRYAGEYGIVFYAVPGQAQCPRLNDDCVGYRWDREMTEFRRLDWPSVLKMPHPVMTGLALDIDLYGQDAAEKRPWRSKNEFKDAVAALRETIPVMRCAGFLQSRRGMKASFLLDRPVLARYGWSYMRQFFYFVGCHVRPEKGATARLLRQLKIGQLNLDENAQSWNEVWRLPRIIRSDNGDNLHDMSVALKHLAPLTWEPPRSLLDDDQEQFRKYEYYAIAMRESKHFPVEPAAQQKVYGDVHRYIESVGQVNQHRYMTMFHMCNRIIGGYGVPGADAEKLLLDWDKKNVRPLHNERPDVAHKLVESALKYYAGRPPWCLNGWPEEERPTRIQALQKEDIDRIGGLRPKEYCDALKQKKTISDRKSLACCAAKVAQRLRATSSSDVYRYMVRVAEPGDDLWHLCRWATHGRQASNSERRAS